MALLRRANVIALNSLVSTQVLSAQIATPDTIIAIIIYFHFQVVGTRVRQGRCQVLVVRIHNDHRL